MFRRKKLFRSPIFNVFATALLVVALAVFYKFALANYVSDLEADLETLDTGRLSQIELAPKTAEEALDAIGDVDSVREIDLNLLEYCHDNIRSDIYERICEHMEANEYNDSVWESLCGYTLIALYDLANGLTDDYNYILHDDIDSFTIAFAGDVNLDTTVKHWWSPLIVHTNNRTNLLESSFSTELSEKMLGADVFCINLESPFISANSKPIDNQWRHGSSAENANVLGILGVDMVNIANDRIYDYGATGLANTISALDLINIDYIGGGSNLEDARTPRYIIAGGRKIAVVSAAQTKNEKMPPEAGAKTSGVIYATNSTYFTAMINEAKENADYVIVYTDWSNSANEKPDTIQMALAHSFVDAGANIVIGTRGTVMQSIEYYNDTPIIYGIGNFWYETDRHEALLVELNFSRDTIIQSASITDSHFDETKTRYSVNKSPSVVLTPCVQEKAITHSVIGTEEGNAIFTKLISLSNGAINLAENGLLSKSISEAPAEEGTNS